MLFPYMFVIHGPESFTDQTATWDLQRMQEMAKIPTAYEHNTLLLGCKTLQVSLNFI